jgi:hypothetical protein
MHPKFESYFVKALHDAKIHEIAEQYRWKKGYEVFLDQEAEAKVPDLKDLRYGRSRYWPDLVIQKQNKNGARTILYEVKVSPDPMRKDTSQQLDALRKQVQAKGYDFRLVTIVRPTPQKIAIDWLNEALLKYLREYKPDLIQPLSVQSNYKEVEAVVHSVEVAGKEATVYIYGNVSVELQVTSNSSAKTSRRRGLVLSHTFPFEGNLVLDLEKGEVLPKGEKLQVDLSSWVSVEEEED